MSWPELIGLLAMLLPFAVGLMFCCCEAPAPTCGCGHDGDWDIEWTSVVDVTCSNCDTDANGIFTLSGPPTVSTVGTVEVCQWGPTPDATGCAAGPNAIRVRFEHDTIAGTYRVQVFVTVNTFAGFGGRTATFELDNGTDPFSCEDFSAEDIPFLNQGGTVATCDWSGATCTLTAVP
jgi:hypothetical protein